MPSCAVFGCRQAALQNMPVDFQLSDTVPLGAAFQAFEDRFQVQFGVREYGIVVRGVADLPTGAVPLHTFWRTATSKGDKTTPK